MDMTFRELAPGILSFEGAAALAGAPSLAVKRIAARGYVARKFNFSGGANSANAWGIGVDDFKKYLSDGAFSLKGIGANDSRWFGASNAAIRTAEMLALTATVPNDAEALGIIRARRGAAGVQTGLFEFALAINQVQKNILAGPAGDSRYPSAGAELCVSRLRDATRATITRQPNVFIASPISALYNSPDDYKKFTAAGLVEMKKRPVLSMTRGIPLGGGRSTTAMFCLPMPAVLEAVGIDDDRLIDMSF